jgi:hypothetical protein
MPIPSASLAPGWSAAGAGLFLNRYYDQEQLLVPPQQTKEFGSVA